MKKHLYAIFLMLAHWFFWTVVYGAILGMLMFIDSGIAPSMPFVLGTGTIWYCLMEALEYRVKTAYEFIKERKIK